MYAMSNEANVRAEHGRRMSIRAGSAARKHYRPAPAESDGRR